MILVNTDYITGKELEMLGLVRGSTIQSKHVGKDIAQAFNRFYHDEHILVDNEEEKVAKLALVQVAKTAIKNGLALLGMEAPERM